MDMKLINQAIKESLPQAVGEVLTKELLELEELRDKINDLVSENQNLLNINHVLKKENENLRQKEIEIEHSIRIIEESQKKEFEVHKKTSVHEAKVEAFQKLLELQEQRVKDMKDVLIAVFKSPVYRTYTHGTAPLHDVNGHVVSGFFDLKKDLTVE